MQNETPAPPTDETQGVSDETQGLFGNLLASKPSRSGASATAATATSLVVHAVIISGLVWATMALGAAIEEDEPEQITLFQLEEEPPPPPPEEEPPPPPDEPPPPSSAPAVEVPRGFQTLAPPDVILPDIPPPSTGIPISALDFTGEGVEGGRHDGNPEVKEAPPEDIFDAPMLTPREVEPRLRNVAEVERAMERYYPTALKEAGIGGRVVLWFLINEEGRVVRTVLQQSSGYAMLDEAAAKVAPVMRFSPALHRDERVMVWVEIPITFQARR